MATDRTGSGDQQPFGPFVLERRIAVGGSAEVFLARPKIGLQPAAHLVVKKLLRAAREGGDFDALEREAALHRAVVHRNVVNVFGAGMVGDEPYLAMEYVDGVDLYRLLRRAEADQRRIPIGLGIFVARRVLHRIDAMTETSRTIMAGDLSGRLPTAGSEDELDRLAVNLNVMLERIEALMRGFKEVSDNIAHDLKTPLTRLRNRAEEALRSGKNEADYRAALDSTIEESDELIRTFNALLMIARAESGQASTPMIEFDAADIVRGVGELYDPLADEKGLTLKIEAGTTLPVRGNRELVTQALANLVDNAIKYARPHEAEANGMPADVVIAASGEGDRIRLSVSDHGPGVSAGDRERVVQRFVRLEQSRSEPGSGLGLSLASAVAHLHGGELRLEDNGPGLKATLDLPSGGPQLPQPNE